MTYVAEAHPSTGYRIEVKVPAAVGFSFASLSGSLGSDTFAAIQATMSSATPRVRIVFTALRPTRMQFLAEHFAGFVGDTPGVIWHPRPF
jgi:hypothetical protein